MESASGPSAVATAASQPEVTEISDAKRPRTRASLLPERIASDPSRWSRLSFRAMRRASKPERSRCAELSSARSSACSFSARASADLVDSKSASRVGSEASSPAILVSSKANSSWKFCRRAAASSRDFVKRAISALVASIRERSPLMCPSWRAVPSR